MHRLLTLIVLCLSISAMAAPGSVSLSLGHQDQIQLNEVDTKKESQSVTLATPTLFNSLTLKAQYLAEQTDISTRNLTTSTGQEIRLSEVDDGKRQLLTMGAEYSTGYFLAAFLTSQDIDSSVFARKSHSLTLQVSPYSGATRIFFSGEISKQDQPVSFFTDPETLQSRQRLSEIRGQILTFGIEQILSESLRAQISYSDSRFFAYRPRQEKILAASSYALSTRSTLRFDLGSSFENRSEPLKDDRGYFEARWLEAQYSYEIYLDTLIGVGWSTVFESENDPRRLVTTQVGTDAVGLFFDKKFQTFSTVLKISTYKTSQNDTGVSGTGDFKWEF